jgi:hypothetical protein
MDRRARVRLRPAFDCIESRELLSAIVAVLRGHPDGTPSLQAMIAAQQTSPNPNSPHSTPPVVPGSGLPTLKERARIAFHAAFSGPSHSVVGRYTDQSRDLFFRGLGTSSQFIHGDFQMQIVLPANPAVPITGAVYMQDRNINSSGAIAFDLVADPMSLDRRGRPTRLTFTGDPNIYSGVDYANTSNGTVTIRYFKDTAAVFFKGTVYTNGITNPLRNMDLQARGGRLVPRGI